MQNLRHVQYKTQGGDKPIVDLDSGVPYIHSVTQLLVCIQAAGLAGLHLKFHGAKLDCCIVNVCLHGVPISLLQEAETEADAHIDRASS